MTRARQPLSQWAFAIRAKPPPAIIRPVQNALPAGMKCLMHTCLTSRLLCLWDSMRKLIILAIVVKPRFARPVKAWREFLPRGYLPLPHPSPRNQPWLVRNPWFEERFVLELQNIIRTNVAANVAPRFPSHYSRDGATRLHAPRSRHTAAQTLPWPPRGSTANHCREPSQRQMPTEVDSEGRDKARMSHLLGAAGEFARSPRNGCRTRLVRWKITTLSSPFSWIIGRRKPPSKNWPPSVSIIGTSAWSAEHTTTTRSSAVFTAPAIEFEVLGRARRLLGRPLGLAWRAGHQPARRRSLHRARRLRQHTDFRDRIRHRGRDRRRDFGGRPRRLGRRPLHHWHPAR